LRKRQAFKPKLLKEIALDDMGSQARLESLCLSWVKSGSESL
jgi:hypothetical protein